MMGVLSEEFGVRSFTTNKNTENANITVMLSDSFSSESGGSQYTCNDCQNKRTLNPLKCSKNYSSYSLMNTGNNSSIFHRKINLFDLILIRRSPVIFV